MLLSKSKIVTFLFFAESLKVLTLYAIKISQNLAIFLYLSPLWYSKTSRSSFWALSLLTTSVFWWAPSFVKSAEYDFKQLCLSFR